MSKMKLLSDLGVKVQILNIWLSGMAGLYYDYLKIGADSE